MRNAAAEARRVLVGMAADALKIPADDIVRASGVAASKRDRSKKGTYADLIGRRWFDVPVKWNKIVGHSLGLEGIAKPKDPKVIGASPRRRDVAAKILGTEEDVVDVKAPGMVHARLVLPRWPAPFRAWWTTLRSRTFPARRWCMRRIFLLWWLPGDGMRSRRRAI
ncbi:MAG: nicB 1 [Hyphomicrobiales bacterium]|nr:nicB 1 [Hyphomicrobiales bacterium]